MYPNWYGTSYSYFIIYFIFFLQLSNYERYIRKELIINYFRFIYFFNNKLIQLFSTKVFITLFKNIFFIFLRLI